MSFLPDTALTDSLLEHKHNFLHAGSTYEKVVLGINRIFACKISSFEKGVFE